jgi:peptide/nickel transport system substrate-binding protein
VPYAKVEGGTGSVGADYGKQPISSGPFVFTKYVWTQSVINTFVRNNKFWKQSD